MELEAAAKHSVTVVILVKEGARWGDASGNMLTYPPAQTIKALKPSVQTVFALKAVHHRCVFVCEGSDALVEMFET